MKQLFVLDVSRSSVLLGWIRSNNTNRFDVVPIRHAHWYGSAVISCSATSVIILIILIVLVVVLVTLLRCLLLVSKVHVVNSNVLYCYILVNDCLVSLAAAILGGIITRAIVSIVEIVLTVWSFLKSTYARVKAIKFGGIIVLIIFLVRSNLFFFFNTLKYCLSAIVFLST